MIRFNTTDPLPLSIILPIQVRSWLRVGATGEEATISMLIQASLSWAENYCDQPLFVRTYTATVDAIHGAILPGKFPRNVTFQTDTAGVLTTYINPYSVDHFGTIYLQTTPPTVDGQTYRITYTAGYDSQQSATAFQVPADLQNALLVYIATRYDKRDDSVHERATLSEALLRPYKRFAL